MSLREVRSSDAPSLFALIADDPEVLKYISAPPPSPEAFAGFIAWSRRERLAGKALCFAVVPIGLTQAVGLFQIRALTPEFSIAEWGFALGSAFWSTGLFAEAATLVADFTFDVLGAHRIEGRAATANARGNGALVKLGAMGEAVLRSALAQDGAYQEQLLWSIIRDEWKERRTRAGERFSAEAIEQNIRRGECQAQLAATAPPTSSIRAQLYPFFISGRAR